MTSTRKPSAYLIDTGPLIAVLNRRDRFHRWALGTFNALDATLITCEAVLSEAWFLARRGGADPRRVVDLVERLSLEVVPAWQVRTVEFLKRYPDRISVADASLLALAEAERDRVVVTTDRDDFSVFRIHRRQAVPALMPPEENG